MGRAGWALPCLLLLRCAPPAENFTDEARQVAAYAVERYADSTVETLGELVRFRTVTTSPTRTMMEGVLTVLPLS